MVMFGLKGVVKSQFLVGVVVLLAAQPGWAEEARGRGDERTKGKRK